MRKALIYGLVFAMCGNVLGVADAAYIIKLKNGNEYITTRYWQEGRQVFFDTYDGVFGIEHTFVTKIEKTDQIIRLASAADRDPAEKAQSDLSKQTKEPDDAKPTEESKAEKKRDPNDPIVGEFNRLQEKSKEVDGMLTEEIRALLREIKAFKDKISDNSKLFVEYSREFNDLHELSSAVEAAFNARR
ncbi:MAG TPA: hypothetical protein VGW77_19550 [Candidatus Binatia bacterium]|nr:hypothetical protein [Candidatus Binatia bacterium]